jgi:hypothetical protein
MGTATLGFAGGPAIVFRLDPESIGWNWQILTNVVDTIGGRVIQVTGAWLDDLTVEGSFGQDHSTPDGESWRQAEAFLRLVTALMEFQARDSNQQDLTHPPAIFTFPEKGWRFQVYIKDFSDADGGGSVVLAPGKFNNRYQLTLFIVQDASASLVQAGTTNGVISQKSEEAIAAYFARISDCVGWHFSQYNGPVGGVNAKWITNFKTSQAPTAVAPVPAGGKAKPGPVTGTGAGGAGNPGVAWWIEPPGVIVQVSAATAASEGLIGPFLSRADAAKALKSGSG